MFLVVKLSQLHDLQFVYLINLIPYYIPDHKVTTTNSSCSVGASQDLWFVYSPAGAHDQLTAVNSV